MESTAIITNRYALKNFASKTIPEDTLKDILKLAQRAPSSFNSQPYRCVLSRTQEDREKLASTMLASNAGKVKVAPVIVTVVSDCSPSDQLPRVQELKRNAGEPEGMVAALPSLVQLFSGEKQEIPEGLQKIVPESMTHGADIPTVAWATKQASMFAATLMYAAQAYGVDSCPMEGFDEPAVRKALGISDRHFVPVMVCLGYPAEDAVKPKETPRLPPQEMYYEGVFGKESKELFN